MTTAQAAATTAPTRNPIHLVDTAEIPGGGQLQLLRCLDEYSIQYGTEELMGSEVRHSEQALATLTCERLGNREATILIGGLGMGFTLGATLAASPPGATIVVAELVPKVLEWAQGPLAHLFGACLDDPRVTVELADVHDVIDAADGRFDAILLDVDNGPDGLIQLANDRLYCNWGLRAAFAALRPGGILAVWSAYPDDAFVLRLEKAGFAVEEVHIQCPVQPERGINPLWFATRPA
ncbi:spermidine synthase [Sphingomonas solaris]|uniref:Spermidine synthase n=1 Tax=Alterirhizorhabdus solaris TaxID=2529389 RepID=A0A558QTV1_9SPHN|nr:spermidine synthase [Sphingomonas solaris]TVV70570.1 spermidine synthase [Sphingomonas solaris]